MEFLRKYIVIILLLAGGISVFALYSNTKGTAALSTTNQVTIEAPPMEPSGDNVSPTFHAKVQTLKAELQKSPTDTTYLFELGRLMQDAHKMEEAVTWYTKYLDINPKNRDVWLDLSLCYGEIGDWEKALSSVNALLQLYPNDAQALYNAGAIYANQTDFNKAQDYWHRALPFADENLKNRIQSALRRISTS